MTIVDPPNLANTGDVIHYRFTVTNTGNVTLTNVTLTDPPIDVSGGPIPSLLPGASDNTSFTAAYTLTQTDIDTGHFTNAATVSGKPPFGDNVTDTDSKTILFVAGPEIDLVKDGTLDMTVVTPPNQANPGDQINYTFTVTNTGNVSLTNITVTDPLVTISGGPISLAVGASDNTTFTGFYILTQSEIDAGHVDNTATVTGTPPIGPDVTDNHTKTVTIPEDDSIQLIKNGTLDMTVVPPPNQANPGDVINYTFTVTNTGNATLANVTVTDPKVTVSGSPLASLAPGASDNTTFSGVYVLTQADIDAGLVDNSATVSGISPDGDNVTDNDTKTVTIPEDDSIQLIKNGTLDMTVVPPPNQANPGDVINYTFIVTNTGNATLANVTVTDPKVTVSGSPLASLAPGASDNTTFSGVYVLTQADIDAGLVDNTATVWGISPDGDNVTDNDTKTVTIPEDDSIQLVKNGALDMTVVPPPNQANPGDVINYTFTVTNTGNATLANVTVTDPKVNVSGSPLASLAPGASDNTTFSGVYVLTQADIDAGLVDNSATVSGISPDGDNVTDNDTKTVTIPEDDSIQLIKNGTLDMTVVPPPNQANPGDVINYTFIVTNTGNATLANVTVTDPKVTVSGSPLASLAPGASDNTTFSGVYVLTQADIDAGLVDNTATVSGISPDGDNVTDNDTKTVTIPEDDSIQLVKNGALDMTVVPPPNQANPGDVINYTFIVTNTGNATLANVTVTDPKVTVSGSPLASLAPGASDNTTFSGVYVLTQADIDAGLVDNTATVWGISPDGDNVTDNDTKTVTIPEDDSIQLVKNGALDMTVVPPPNQANPGDVINYTFTVTNTGNATLANVTVTDPKVNVSGSPLASLAPGASDNTTFSGVYVLTQADIDAGLVDNSATVSGISPDGDNVTDNDTKTVTIPEDDSIQLIKNGTLDMTVVPPPNQANPGDVINYTFIVTNTGNATLANVTVTDPKVTVSGSPLASLAPGASDNTTFSGVYVLTQADIDAGLVDNTATVWGISPDGDNVTDNDTKTVTLPNDDSIQLIKDGTLDMTVVSPPSQANLGDQINYTFTVTNTGNVTLNNVTVTDPKVTIIGGPIATMLPGATDNTTFTGTYTLGAEDFSATLVENTAMATGTPSSGPQVSDNDTKIIIIPVSAPIQSIQLVKDGTLDMTVVPPDTQANPGDKINYTFTVTNTGAGTLTNIMVTDSKVTVIGGPISSLDPGASDNTTFTGAYTLTQADINANVVSNTATATGTPPQGDDVTDEHSKNITIPQDLSIQMVKDGALDMTFVPPSNQTNPGDKINYTFTVTNTGNVTITNVQVTDPKVTVIGSPILSLAPGSSDNTTFTGTYTLTQTDINAGIVHNTATATGTPPTGPDITDEHSKDITIPQEHSIQLVKDGSLDMTVVPSNTEANPGDRIQYTFTVTNTGNVTLTNVIVTDPKVSVSGGPIVSLAPGASNGSTFTGTYTLTQADINAGKVDNTATATGAPPSGPAVTDQHSKTVNITKIPNIVIVKHGVLDMTVVSPSNQTNVGDAIRYTFSVTNTGNVTLTNITVTDPKVTVVGGPLASLAPGATNNVAFTGTYTITQFDIDAGGVDNRAYASGTPPEGPRVTNPGTETVMIPVNAGTGQLIINKQDIHLQQTINLPGATFTVVPNPYGPGVLTVADNDVHDSNPANGLIELDDVPFGLYSIAETVAPPGYLLNPTAQIITVGSSGPLNVTIYDMPETLPNVPVLSFWGGLSLVLLMGLALIWRTRRKSKAG